MEQQHYDRYKVLWPLVPAMAMVMIDFTIVSISVTTIQRDLHLSATAAQWTVTAYALATAAFIALGGRLGDIFGHKRIVAIGIILFAGASTLCGLTPDTSIAEPWLITCRVLQGIGGALLIPSTTAVGPIAGSYLTQYWTWRAIFWINIPVALLSLTEFAFVKLKDVKHPARIDWGGAALLVAGMGLTVLGLQESSTWGWGSLATIGSIIAGIVILGLFVVYERRAESPLISIQAFIDNRPFAVDNVLTLFLFFTWLAVFFFGSIYFQVSVGQEPTQAGFSILTMFYSFFIASRIGGGMYDKIGAKHPVSIGLAAIAVGLWLWASELSKLTSGGTLAGMLVTGAGFGLAMSALNTDALNRAPKEIRGEASGIVQTFRNFGSALGMAILGTIVLGALGPHTTPSGFADALETAFKVGAIVMAVSFVISRVFMPSGKQADVE